MLLNGTDTVTETVILVAAKVPVIVGAGIVVVTSFATNPVAGRVWLNSASTVARTNSCQLDSVALVVG